MIELELAERFGDSHRLHVTSKKFIESVASNCDPYDRHLSLPLDMLDSKIYGFCQHKRTKDRYE